MHVGEEITVPGENHCPTNNLPGPLSIKLLCSACEVLVVKNTKGEQ